MKYFQEVGAQEMISNHREAWRSVMGRRIFRKLKFICKQMTSLVITWGWEKEGEREGLLIEEEFPLGVVKIFWKWVEVLGAQRCKYTGGH